MWNNEETGLEGTGRPRLNILPQHEKMDSTNVEEIGEKTI